MLPKYCSFFSLGVLCLAGLWHREWNSSVEKCLAGISQSHVLCVPPGNECLSPPSRHCPWQPQQGGTQTWRDKCPLPHQQLLLLFICLPNFPPLFVVGIIMQLHFHNLTLLLQRIAHLENMVLLEHTHLERSNLTECKGCWLIATSELWWLLCPEGSFGRPFVMSKVLCGILVLTTQVNWCSAPPSLKYHNNV